MAARSVDVRWLAGCLLLACSAFAAGPTPEEIAGQGQVIRINAASMFRWQQGGATLMDLRGSVQVYQGDVGLTAQRLMAWFSEDRKTGVLDLFGEGVTIRQGGNARTEDGPHLFRLTTQGGLVLNAAASESGDAPKSDPFLRSAALFRRGESAETAGPAGDILGDVLPSAEEMSIEDVTDAGAMVTLRGNAVISTRDIEISADVIRVRILFREPQRKSPVAESVYAEGVVQLRRGEETITADALYMDLLGDTGMALGAGIRTNVLQGRLPVQFRADAIRQDSRERFSFEGPAYVTTSQFDQPHYRIESRDVQAVIGPAPQRLQDERAYAVRKGEAPAKAAQQQSVVVSARHSLLYLGDVPVLYWPYVAKDIRSGAFLVKSVDFGNSSTFGRFLRIGWDVYDFAPVSNDWSQMTLRTDYYSARGFGSGLDFNYRTEERFGFFRGYYIHDTAELDDKDLPVLERNRGELTWRHREQLSDAWRADAELGWLSDRRFLHTYDRDEYDTGKDRETTLFVTRREENTLLTLQARERINDFQNQTDRESVSYHVFAQDLFDTPILWTSHNDLARLRLRNDEDLGLKDPDPLGRLDSAHEVSWPFQLDAVKLDPFLWGDVTAFTRQADEDQAAARAASAFGARGSMNFYRVYDAHSDLFGVDRLRHVITPKVEYRNIWGVTGSPDDFIQNDEVDALDEAQYAVVGVRNRLQTYRNVDGRREQADFLVSDLDYLAAISGRPVNRSRDDFVHANLRWIVTPNVTLASEDDYYNVDKHRLEAANGEVSLDYWRPLNVTLLQKYYLDLASAGEPSHNVTALVLGYQPEYGRWRVDFTTAYDFSPSVTPDGTKRHNLGTGLFFTRYLEQWAVTFGVELNQGRVNETRLSFKVTPPGTRRSVRPYALGGQY